MSTPVVDLGVPNQPTDLIEQNRVHTTWLGRRRGLRRLAIGLLIASIVHVPLPQADFHNVRHHDAPGEVCPLHDHLLRWHPAADVDDDVAIVHWHWFIPFEELGVHSNPRDGHHGAGAGPAMHAQAGEQFDFDWHFDPVCQSADGVSLVQERVLRSFTPDLAVLNSPDSLPSSSPRPDELPSRGFRAPVSFAPSVRLNC